MKRNNTITNQKELENDLLIKENVFSKQVEEVINDTYPSSDMLIVNENTPQVLQNIGLKNVPITMTQRHLKTIMEADGEYKGANYHDLGVYLVKQLSCALIEPLYILKSKTKEDSIVVITDLKDRQERPIIISIKMNGKGVINNKEIDSNILTSAYGRNNYDKFMQDNFLKGNLLYNRDLGIIKRSDGKLQLRPTTSSDNNISQTSTNVNSDISSNYDMKLKESYVINEEELKEINGGSCSLIKYLLKKWRIIYE